MRTSNLIRRLISPNADDRRIVALCAFVALAFAAPARADGARIIVKLKAEATKSGASVKARIDKLAQAAGTPLAYVRPMALGADVVQAEGASDPERVALQMAADPDVEFAEVDYRRHAMQVLPINDIFAPQQHYLANGPTEISAFAAWGVTHGSASVVVADIDSGYRPHAAMQGRILPGYDMISDSDVANDGDGRDPDATDPGDWLTPADLTGIFEGCDAEWSSWHGTSVAGIIVANTNDGAWTAGIDWAARLLPVRVLGRCGGFDSDIVDGIAWAAGLPVPGVPDNPTPAQVINLSLGGQSTCPPAYVSVAEAAYAHGVTRALVAAAGNESQDVSLSAPANCPGYIAVAATTDRTGSLAQYSNFGAGVAVSAPAGALFFQTPADSTFVLSNTGTTTPLADTTRNEGGTSFAAPMVSGTISLMLAVAPSLTADQVRSIIVTTAKPFPVGSDCTTDRCGAGIVDAAAAVTAAAAMAPPAANYEGLWWKAPAGSESGWGINFAHQGDVIFATWFTYDDAGKAWWLSMTANKAANKAASDTYSGTLYQTHGPAFDAVPFSPAAVTATPVGSGTLTFSNGNAATFSYTVNGISQAKPITRQVFGPLPTCTFGAQPNLALATNYQDLWWASPAGSESGWGVNLTQQGDTIFATWFTYDLDGTPLWLVVTAQKSGPGVYTGTLYRTTGPAFSAVPFDPAKVTATPVGPATFTFANGNAGTFAYTVNGVSQAKPITRQVFRAPGTVCQ